MKVPFAVNLKDLSYLLLVFVLASSPARTQNVSSHDDPIKYSFDGKRGQVEVGGRYVGMEFHHSRPSPSRISFYYPVANSIDLSTDYWKRDVSLPMAIGLRIGGGAVEWIHRESWSYVLSPHKVTFLKNAGKVAIAIAYEFCFDEPAAVVTIIVKNSGADTMPVQLYTHLMLNVRTCQTYARKDTSWMTFDRRTESMVARFDYVDTDSSAVFVENVGERATEWTTDATEVDATDDGGSQWASGRPSLSNRVPKNAERSRGISAFVFRKLIASQDSLNVAEVIGSCRGVEVGGRIASLRTRWKKDVRAYDEFIHTKSEGEAYFRTGDKIIDRSAVWARALIAANAHYLDGKIVPMPCPAEYNFFFTHDLLLTNLGAVNFDLGRVKSNLLYVASMAKDSVIPHAYYWRDDGFKTEYCEPENWNHLWFVIVSGSYLRHSLDDSTGQVLFPFIEKSVHALLTRLRPDGLMYAYRPDWLDIGHIEGPRTYLTALAVRALREYLFISSFLHRQSGQLVEYEKTADAMQRALVDRLWDTKDEYLTNYNEGEKDYHFYAGSLIASVYDLLDEEHAIKLVTTAKKQLVDDRIGLRIAMPPDFNSDSVVKKFKFEGDQAGQPYSYANGGVWAHGNAWYAMALKDVGKLNESYDFARRTMTIDGIAQSPNGLPAMYEYRNSDPNSQAFGTIDKPSLLWGGGMYLQVVYRLLAIDENPWNIGIRNELPSQCDSVTCSFTFGGLKKLVIKGSSNVPGPLIADGELVPSRILPLDLRANRAWESSVSNGVEPVLVSANAIVHSAKYDRSTKQYHLIVSSFDGHKIQLVVVGKSSPKHLAVNGKRQHRLKTSLTGKSRTNTTIEFSGSAEQQRITLDY